MQLRQQHGLRIVAMVALALDAATPIATAQVAGEPSTISVDVGQTGPTFSSTQSWNPDYAYFIGRETAYLKDWTTKISLPPPPGSASVVTAAELARLVELQNRRTSQNVAAIGREQVLAPLDVIRAMAPDVQGVSLDSTAYMFTAIEHDVAVVVFTLKKRFDRIRPAFLSDAIDPAIATPAHPAYPSGHATQAFVYAGILGRLTPANAEAFDSAAQQIAVNREIAGVHYPSDTAAGIALARQIVAQLFVSEEFRALFEAARPEWR